MIAPPPRQNKIMDFILGVALIVFIAFGIWYLGLSAIHAVQNILQSKPLTSGVGATWIRITGWINIYATPLGTIAVAIATFFLWRATAALVRSSEAQLAASAPFLEINFEIDPVLLSRTSSPDYRAEWTQQDLAQPMLAGHVQGVPSRYINVLLSNKQANPHGVAAQIQMDLVLCWGGNDGDATRPYEMQRSVFVSAIRAGENMAGPVFNVGNVPGFKVIITDVRYLDMGRRKRRAAYACGFDAWSTGHLVRLPVVIEPEKDEIGLWQTGKRGK